MMVSASVGVSGSTETRRLVVAAMARSLPSLIKGMTAFRLPDIMKSSRPESRSGRAAALPLYGIWLNSVPVLAANSTLVRWSMVPLPDEPKLSLPGLDLSRLRNSCGVFTGVDALTITTSGTVATYATGVKIWPGFRAGL